jgi:hypothetical protein
VSLLAAAADVVAMIAAVGLVLPAARRTGLSIWHPAVAWLALEILFFGAGSAILAVTDDRSGPAAFVGAAILTFGLAVAAGDRLARRRSEGAAVRNGWQAAFDPGGSGEFRPLAVVFLAVVGVAALLPTLLTVGIPILAGDITGARTEVGGLDLQILRVALPAAVLVAVLVAVRSGDRRARLLAVATFAIAAVAELALASRYLAAELIAAVVLGLGIGRRPIPSRPVALIGLAAAVVFVTVGVLRAYDQAAGREIGFAVERTVNRILLIEPRTLDALQSAIPAEQPFFGGLTWVRRLAPWFGRGDVPNLGYWIYPRLFPDQAIPGYAAPGLIGEAWANLGWLGLALFAALGILVERLGALVAMRRRAVADVVAAALLVLFVARTHALGLNGLAVVVILIAGWRLLAAPIDRLGGDIGRVARWRT